MKNYYKFAAIGLFLYSIGVHAQTSLGWTELGSGTAGNVPYVKALEMQPLLATVYAGGDFTTAGGIKANHIALCNYNNNIWDTLGYGTNNEVTALKLYKNTLYAGGKFDTAGRIKANYIASWDNTQWDSVKGGLNGSVYALCVYNNALYVGGSFTMANGIKASRIAKWDGTVWDSVGPGLDSTVYALAVFKDTLYAGGIFTKSNGVSVNYIARWDGHAWDSLGGGMNAPVYALDSFYYQKGPIHGPALYAGGAFTTSGGIVTNHIAAWTPQHKWDSVGTGTNDTVRALDIGQAIPAEKIDPGTQRTMEIQINFLMVGGNFTKAGTLNTPYFSIWDDSSWDYLAYANKPVYSLVSNQPDFTQSLNFAGGAFDTTATVQGTTFYTTQTNYIAELNVAVGSSINELSYKNNISIYPNPSDGLFTLNIKDETLEAKVFVEIYNTTGQEIYRISTDAFLSATPQFHLNMQDQPNGLYLCRIVTDTGKLLGTAKLIIQR